MGISALSHEGGNMTVLVQAIRERMDIEVIDLNDIAYRIGVFILKFGFKLIWQMILTVIATTWIILWLSGVVLSNLH
jgi:hypothetical protein